MVIEWGLSASDGDLRKEIGNAEASSLPPVCRADDLALEGSRFRV
jgi:hypothetical protein